MDKKSKKNIVILVFLLCCSLSAALLVIISGIKYGPGMTHDSAAYMYAAESLLKGEGFQYFGYPSPFIQWPPLFPALLALGGIFGLSAGTASTLINSLAFAFIIFLAGRWMLERFSSAVLAAGGTLLLLLSVPLLQVSRYLWSETLFILFFLLFYLQFERFLRHGRYSSLILAACFSALACMDRYAGVTIVAAAGLVLLFTKKALLRRITDAAIYGIISVFPMGVWVLRNYLVSGTLLGVRLPSPYSLRLNIKRSMESIYSWVQPDRLLTRHIDGLIVNGLKALAVLLPLIVIAALLSVLARKMADPHAAYRIPSDLKTDSARLLPIAFFALFSGIYVAYLVASATAVAFEPINSRYLVPVYLPFLLIFMTSGDYLASRLGERLNMRAVKYSICLLLALFMIYPALNTAASVLVSYRSGAGGYASDSWYDKSGFIPYMQNNESGTFYSNNADAVYTLSGIRTYYPPKKSGPHMYGVEQFRAAISRDESSFIIWFSNGVPQTLYNLEDMAQLFELEKIGEFEDGEVYKVVN